MAKIIDLKSRKVLADLPTDMPSKRYAMPYVATDGSNVGAIAFSPEEAGRFIRAAQAIASEKRVSIDDWSQWAACPDCYNSECGLCSKHDSAEELPKRKHKITDWFPGFRGNDPDDAA